MCWNSEPEEQKNMLKKKGKRTVNGGKAAPNKDLGIPNEYDFKNEY